MSRDWERKIAMDNSTHGVPDAANTSYEGRLRSAKTASEQLSIIRDFAANLEATKRGVSAELLVRLCTACNEGDLETIREYDTADFQGSPVRSLPSSPALTSSASQDLAAYTDELSRYLEHRSLNLPLELVTTYAGIISSAEVLRSLSLSDSLDLHEFAVLVVERALGAFTQASGEATADAPVDLAIFEWLHLRTHGSVPAGWSEEALRRREIRIANIRQPVVRVLAMVCEQRLPEDLLERAVRVARGGELDWHSIFGALADLHRRDTDESGEWRERLSGFAAEERRFFTEDSNDAPLPWVAGNIWGWLARRRVLTPATQEVSLSYARSVVAVRESDRRHDRKRSVATYHIVAVRALLRRGVEVPLGCELGLLAWLTDQFNVKYSLNAFLDARQRELADLG